ncbi:sodium:proton antiporter [Pontibacillus halophilus JSM 076056 = DSM 19796]|uniref:Sodium:proton antiporter n=1 Tax=Pontibacillus halophilus JSM 076056 = DSM 19796 TaxID=1385510 RepID=A0A0A5GIB2_9BACI|nr:Na+/H+ antiporter NhaC family protein [Pontibacillus halophilus]KGX92976.1 sodium:proton antiporter [Pontibacillus halophilus JSM 076056 = DSM 19796]
MAWSVVVSVLVMTVLSLLRVNVIVAILAAGITGGLMAGLTLVESLELLIGGMGGQANTALSYVLLGAFAVSIAYSGITSVLVRNLVNVMKGKRIVLLLSIAFISSLSQFAIPVHIAFIPILIPPMLKLFDKMRIDRRGVATALTFGLKAPYMAIPLGFGFLFQKTIRDAMSENGAEVALGEVTQAMLLPTMGMVVGLLIAVFISYRKPKDARQIESEASVDLMNAAEEKDTRFTKEHLFTIVAIVGALAVQIVTQQLVLSALAGLILMFVFRIVPFNRGDKVVAEGVSMMGVIAFIMLVASGYATVLKDTGAVDVLVENTSDILGDNKAVIAFVLLLIGLIITMGIGSSFSTVPILAALYVPICTAVGFSPLATAALIGTAGALGDAGSPASDSTLGPTSGLNADGRHNHIWDTVVPTFLHYNIPLFIFGWITAIIL